MTMPLNKFPDAIDAFTDAADPPETAMPSAPFPDAIDAWILAESPETLMPPLLFPDAFEDTILAKSPPTTIPAPWFPELSTPETLIVSASIPRTPQVKLRTTPF